MFALSVLDLAPIVEGGDAGTALRNSADLAARTEAFGFRRFWLAEHHNMPGIASAATAVAIAHVAAATSTIRVGAGGIMLPNHAPLVIAEQFGTLAALHRGRVDLGLGRAPGTDQVTAMALRRTLNSEVDSFPNDVVELMDYFAPDRPGRRVHAIPGEGEEVEVWILGSSLYGAQLAALLGLPYAFASHFAPGEMERAISIYRERFTPSPRLERPYVMIGVNLAAAGTDEEAEYLFSSRKLAFLRLRTGRPGPLPPPVPDLDAGLDPALRRLMEQSLRCSVVGSPETVQRDLARLADETGADEMMLTSHVFDHHSRVRGFEIAANAWRRLRDGNEPEAGRPGDDAR